MATANKEQYEALRHRARTDLFWLSKEVLGYRDMIERVHQPLCEMFVRKDNTKSIADQDEIKERLILDSRGTFKTTIDICDAIQWILNFPDMRLNFMTGSLSLAKRMLWECKEHFRSNPTLRDLFPEYAPLQNKEFGTQEEFTVPARQATYLREPTVSVSTVDSVKAGSHYDVIKCDDLVNETNIGTPEQIEKTITAYNYTTPLLEPYGYRDVIGTRYDHSDLYGWIIDNNESGRVKVFKRAVHVSGDWGNPNSLITLVFPERFTVEWLEAQRHRDPYIFSCQYQNDPTPPDQKHFTENMIIAHTIPVTQIPALGRTFLTWDLGFSRKEYSDFSVGAVGRYNEFGQLFILDLFRGRFSPYELIDSMLKAIKRWSPARMGVEKAAGSDLALPGLTLTARDRRILLPPIDWLPTSPLVKKIERIAGLHPLLHESKNERCGLYFSAAIPCREDLIKEFARFPKYRRNDIPDAISMLLNYRSCIDIEIPADQIEFISSPVRGVDGALGAGLCG